MEIYQHDSAAMFRFVLRGELIDGRVTELEHAWSTAKSILKGKELVVEISGITNADSRGVDLLFRMRESGARLSPELPRELEAFSEFIRPRPRQPGRRWCMLFGKVLHTFGQRSAQRTRGRCDHLGSCRSSAPAAASDGGLAR